MTFQNYLTTQNDLYNADDVHGTDGPLNVDTNRFAPLEKEWMEVGKEMGYKVKDPNGAGQDEGYFY